MKDKIVFLLRMLLVFSTIITLLFINTAYSKYQDAYDTNYKLGIHSWLIKVNTHDIQEVETLNGVVELKWIENEHMDDDLLVPARQGYFEFDIDYTYADVDFDFKVKMRQLNENRLEDFRIYRIFY